MALTTITGWFTAHRRDVSIETINDILDKTAVPLATENLIHGLLAGDKDYTLEVLKGRGQLRRHSDTDKPPQQALPELRIVFEANHNPQTPMPITATGKVLGTPSAPRQIEGTVVESRPIEAPDGATFGTGTVSIPRPAQPTEGADSGGEVPTE